MIKKKGENTGNSENECENSSAKISFTITLSPEKANAMNYIFASGEAVNEDMVAEKIMKLFSEPEYPYKPPRQSMQAEKTANHLLSEFSIPANTKGYRYLRDAIVLVVYNPELMEKVTGSLYPEIARFHNTTPVRVERVIRHAIETGFLKTDTDVLYAYFSGCLSGEKGKPSNSHFIAVLSEEVRERMAS